MKTPSIDKIAGSGPFRMLVKHVPGLALAAARTAAIRNHRHAVANGIADGLSNNLKFAFNGKSEGEIEELACKHQIALYEAHVILNRLVNTGTKHLSAYVARSVDIDGQEILAEIGRRQGPAILMTPHYGAFGSACLRLIQELGPHKRLNIFFDDPKKNSTTKVFVPLIERFAGNSRVLFNNRRSALLGLKALRDNEILTMMPDVYDVTGNHVMVPFLGSLSSAMTGTAFFSLKSGAPIYPVYCYPVYGYHCRLEVHPAIAVKPSGDLEQDMYSLTAAIFASVERQLRMRPEHWVYWNTLDSRFPSSVTIPGEDTAWPVGFEGLLDEVRRATPALGSFLTELANLEKAHSDGVPSPDAKPGVTGRP